MGKEYRDIYKDQIATFVGIEASQVNLFWKGRVGLYSILKALDVKAGDEVIIPAFTCVVVPNAIIYLGAKPIYVDIDRDTYNIDVSKLEQAITRHTKVIMAQNTFGLSPDIDSIKEIADKYKIAVIEDCTHGFGGLYKNKPNGTIADFAFYSTQWNKPFSTGIGGMTIAKNKEFAHKLSLIESQAIAPSLKEQLILKMLYWIRPIMQHPLFYWPMLKLYRLLSAANIIVGSSQGDELEGTAMPSDFLKQLSAIQAKKGVQELAKLNEVNVHRKWVAAQYTQFLKSIGVKTPYEPTYAEHTYVKYPLLVNSRALFCEKAAQQNIELGEWFVSPIHPITENYTTWEYAWGNNPIAEDISLKIVNLPTGLNIQQKQLNKIFDFLRTQEHLLVKAE